MFRASIRVWLLRVAMLGRDAVPFEVLNTLAGERESFHAGGPRVDLREHGEFFADDSFFDRVSGLRVLAESVVACRNPADGVARDVRGECVFAVCERHRREWCFRGKCSFESELIVPLAHRIVRHEHVRYHAENPCAA